MDLAVIVVAQNASGYHTPTLLCDNITSIPLAFNGVMSIRLLRKRHHLGAYRWIALDLTSGRVVDIETGVMA